MSPDRADVDRNHYILQLTSLRQLGERFPFAKRIAYGVAEIGLAFGAACTPQPQQIQERSTPIVRIVTATPTETPLNTPTPEPLPPTATPRPLIPTPQRQETPPVSTSERPFAPGKVYRSPLFEVKGQSEGDIAISPVSPDQIFIFGVREATCADGSKEQMVTTFLIKPDSIVPDRNFSQTNQLGDLISAGAVPNGQLAGEVIFKDTPPTPNTPACKGKKLFFQADLEKERGRSWLGKIIGDLYQRVRKGGDNPPEAYIKLAEQYCDCKIPAELK